MRNSISTLYKSLAAAFVVLLLAVPVGAQQLRNRVAPICTDVSDTATAQEAGFIPCDWYQTGTFAATPGYVRLVDQNTTLVMDVELLSTLVTGLAGTHNAAITASALFLYDSASGAFGPWHRRFPTSDAMTNSDMGGAPVLSANFGFDAATGRWARFRLDTSFRLITSIQDPLDAGGNVKVGIFDAAGDGPADVNANDDLSVTLNDSAGVAFMDSTTTPGYQRQQDGDSATLRDVLPAVADDLSLTLNWAASASVIMLYDGATLDMARAGATGGMLVDVVNWPNAYDLSNAWTAGMKKETAVYNPAKQTTAAIPTAIQTVYNSTYVLNQPSFTIWVDNTGANVLTDLDIDVSPDGATWLTINLAVIPTHWENNGCANNLASGAICYIRCVAGCTFEYVRVRAAAADASLTDLDVWLDASKQ